MELTTENVVRLITALAAIVGLSFAWRKLRDDIRKNREESYRRGEVLAWSNEAINELQSLLLICIHRDRILGESSSRRLDDIIFNTSILVERGRMFFRNEVIDDYGSDKERACRGYRPLVLDQLVIAHNVACVWGNATDHDEQLRLRCIAEDCLKKFVSMMQQEVGRSHTASADTSLGGDGVNLSYLKRTVSEKRLQALQQSDPYLN